jgi:cytochrome c-type biogenesis protein CcmH/NrfG
VTAPAGRRTARLDPDALAALEDQRDFLLRSLTDLEREHDAGDLDDADYEELRDDYTARAAEVLRAIERQEAAFAEAKRPRRVGRTVAIAAGVVVFAVVAGVMVAKALGARKAGESASGGISVEQTPSQQAQQCVPLIDPASPDKALDCFRAVLDRDDRNVVAKTWLAWQLSQTAQLIPGAQGQELAASAERLLAQAVRDNPDYSYARAFRAVVAYRNGHYADAKRYLAEFRANNPAPDATSVIAQMNLEANIDEALAASTLGGSTTTTTAPTATTTTTTPGG